MEDMSQPEVIKDEEKKAEEDTKELVVIDQTEKLVVAPTSPE